MSSALKPGFFIEKSGKIQAKLKSAFSEHFERTECIDNCFEVILVERSSKSNS